MDHIDVAQTIVARGSCMGISCGKCPLNEGEYECVTRLRVLGLGLEVENTPAIAKLWLEGRVMEGKQQVFVF